MFGGGTSDSSTEDSNQAPASQDQDTHVSSDETAKAEDTGKNWWDLQPNNDVWGEGDNDPWNNANQDAEDNASWGDFFEEDD